MSAPDTGSPKVHPLIPKGLRGRSRSNKPLDLTTADKAALIADICLTTGTKTYFDWVIPALDEFEKEEGLVILRSHEREHLQAQLEIAQKQGKEVELTREELKGFLTFVLNFDALPVAVPLSADPEGYAAPSAETDDSNGRPSELNLADALPITPTASHTESEDGPRSVVEVATEGRTKSDSNAPSPTATMTPSVSPTDSVSHKTPLAPVRPLTPQRIKRPHLRRLSTGSPSLHSEPEKLSRSQSAVISNRRLSDELAEAVATKRWVDGKPQRWVAPWNVEGRPSPSQFGDATRRPSVPSIVPTERLSSSPVSSPIYKGRPFRQPDSDVDGLSLSHSRRQSTSSLLSSSHTRRDSTGSNASTNASPGAYNASRDYQITTLRRDLEEQKVKTQMANHTLYLMGQEQDGIQAELQAKTEEADRATTSLRNAEKQHKTKEEELSRHLQEREADIGNLEDKLSKAKQAVTDQRNKLHAAELEKRELHAALEQRDASNSAMSESLEKAQKEVDAYKTRLVELEARRDSLEDDLATASSRLTELQDVEELYAQSRQDVEELKLKIEEIQAGPRYYAVSAPSSSAPGSVSRTLGAEMLRVTPAEPSSPSVPRTRKTSRRLRLPIPSSPTPGAPEFLSTEMEKADSDPPNTDDDGSNDSEGDDNTEVGADDSLADVSIIVPSSPLLEADTSMTSPPSYNRSPRRAEQVLEAGPSVEKLGADATKVAAAEEEPKPAVILQESKGVMTNEVLPTTEASVPMEHVADDKDAAPVCNDPSHVKLTVLVALIVAAFAIGVAFGASHLSSAPSLKLARDPYGHIHTITSATGLPYSAWHRNGIKNVMEHRGPLRRGRVPT
ncbi:hypothetical protein Q8F55_006745 [Vanrija albida]|uniref:Uncharacterized protein n=1 Tax=Vanrija albida TaxID=181172 RepID=A0ABR3PY18_9TREE